MDLFDAFTAAYQRRQPAVTPEAERVAPPLEAQAPLRANAPPRAAVLPRSVRTPREQARAAAQREARAARREAHARQRREAELRRLDVAQIPRPPLARNAPHQPFTRTGRGLGGREPLPPSAVYTRAMADLEGTWQGTAASILSGGHLDVGNVRRQQRQEEDQAWDTQTAGLSRAEIGAGIDAGEIDRPRTLGPGLGVIEAAGPFPGVVKGAVGAVGRRLGRRGAYDPAVDVAPVRRTYRPPGVTHVPGLGETVHTARGGAPRPPVDLTPKPLSPSARAEDASRIEKFIQRHEIPEAGLGDVRRILREADNFQATRGRTQTWAQTDALAEDLAINVRKMDPKRPLPADEMVALRQTVAGLSGKIAEAAEAVTRAKARVRMGGLSEVERDAATAALPKAEEALYVAMEEAKVGWDVLFGARAAAARSLNSLKKFQKAKDVGDVDFVADAMERGAPQAKIAEALQTMPDDLSRARFLRDLSKPKMQDWWRWYYLSSLLSAPVTQSRNLMGSATRTGAELITPLGAGEVRETVAGFQGAMNGWKEGFKKASYMWKNGYSIDNIDRPPQIKIFGNERWPNVIARSMETGDQFFRAMSAEIAGHTGAFRRARAAGPARSPAFQQRYAEILANRPDDLIKEMAEAGAQAVFRPKPGGAQKGIKAIRTWADMGTEKLGEGVYRLAKSAGLPEAAARPLGIIASAPAGTFLLPFLQTPAGIYRAGAAFSPYGAVVGQYRMSKLRKAGAPSDPYLAGEATAEMARARRLASQGNVGTAMLAPLAWMAWEGRLTGSGPKGDAKERKQWLMNHQPNSILIGGTHIGDDPKGTPLYTGGTWYNYSMFQPIAVPASVMANAWEAWDGDWADVGAIAARTANSQMQASYLTSVMAIQNAIESPERYAPRVMARQAAAFVPLSSFFRNLARAEDPTSRAPEGLMETVQSAMPEWAEQGLRAVSGIPYFPGSPWPSEDTVPARLDLFGEPVVYGPPGESAASRLVNPVYRQRGTDDALVQELSRTGARLTPATGALGTLPLTRRQQFDVEQATARAQAQVVRILIQQPAYASLPAPAQVRAIEGAASEARRSRREGLTEEVEAMVSNLLLTLPPGARRDELNEYMREEGARRDPLAPPEGMEDALKSLEEIAKEHIQREAGGPSASPVN